MSPTEFINLRTQPSRGYHGLRPTHLPAKALFSRCWYRSCKTRIR